MPPILVSCQALSKSHGSRLLFERLSFGLFEGERTGLIGPNGAGKSTLLRILAGLETPDGGLVSARRGLRVGYLPQKDRFENAGGLTVAETAAAGFAGLEVPEYEAQMRVEAGLADAGFADPAQPVAALSGGWRKRLAILGQVLPGPDLLLLDEPTNHLDLAGVLWLERFLSGLGFSYLIVEPPRAAPAGAKRKLTPAEYKEFKGLEGAIQRAEAEAAKAAASLEDPAVATDAAELAKRHEALDVARRKVDALYDRWAELEDT